MADKGPRAFYALVTVKGYKQPFELGNYIIGNDDGVAEAREVIQDVFSMAVDENLYPRLPQNHTPSRSDIKIRWIKPRLSVEVVDASEFVEI